MTVHFWHTDRLVLELEARTLPERSGMLYMLVGSLLYVSNNYYGLWAGAYRDLGFLLELAVIVVISAVGVVACFMANGGDAGKDFVLRFGTLAVPVGVKIALAGVVLAELFRLGVANVVGSSLAVDVGWLSRLYYPCLTVLLECAYYGRLAHHLALLGSSTSAAPR